MKSRHHLLPWKISGKDYLKRNITLMKKQALLKAKSHHIVPLNKGPDKNVGKEGSECQ